MEMLPKEGSGLNSLSKILCEYPRAVLKYFFL